MEFVYPGGLGEIRTATVDGTGASYTAGGHALTTAAKLIQLPQGTTWVQLLPRSFTTAVVVRLALNPWLAILKTANALVTATDASVVLQDADTSTSLSLNSFDTSANSNFLYIGARVPFRGVVVDVSNTNSNASVLTVSYWNGSAWTSASASDGTASGGVTFAQDGNVTWTVPTDWTPTKLRDRVTASVAAIPFAQRDYYWTRWTVSIAFDASVSVLSMLALNRSTAYAELTSSDSLTCAVELGPDRTGCIEALTDAGTANLIVNCSPGPGLRFP